MDYISLMFRFRKFIGLVFVCASMSSSVAQTCVDSTLIDPGMMCPFVWDPVCGCNGVTYGNDCEAVYFGGMTSWVSGECTGTALDCVDLGGIDFGACDMAMGVVMWNGSCTYLSGCGWEVNGVDYSVYSFTSIEECQSNCAETAECIDPSIADPLIDCNIFEPVPVCGCDSLTHFNECVATHVDYVTAFTSGACPGDCFDEARIDQTMGCPEIEDPVCGCDSVTYSNSCEAWYYGGVAQWTAGPCENVQVEQAHALRAFQIFPNPTQGTVQIDAFAGAPIQVQLLSLSGQVVASEKLGLGRTWVLPLGLASGTYFLQIQAPKEQPVSGLVVVE